MSNQPQPWGYQQGQQVNIGDTLLTKAERAISFAKHHLDLLESAIKESDLHTADLLLAVVIKSLMEAHQAVKQLLG